MKGLEIGVLGIQGAIEDHEQALKLAADEINITIDIFRVTLPEELKKIDGLVMPGGESTAMIKIGSKDGMLEAVVNRIRNGMPAFGTCAGAILLSKKVRRTPESQSKPGAFPFLDMEIIRNGYGRQKESFTTTIEIENERMQGVFIRAPVISETDDNIEVLCTIENDPVFIRQGNVMATTFHPELTSNPLIHKIFLQMILDEKTQ